LPPVGKKLQLIQCGTADFNSVKTVRISVKKRTVIVSAWRGQCPDRSRQGEPLWTPGRHHDPGRVPPRLPGCRTVRSAVGPGRIRRRGSACAPDQERHPEHAPDQGRRIAGAAAAGTGRESPASPFVFVSERGSPFTAAGFARMLEQAAVTAGLELKVLPHHHACGYALANKGHDTRAKQGWLGHRSITSTAVYTALAPNRFKDFWRN
jgi:Phage integrase family